MGKVTGAVCPPRGGGDPETGTTSTTDCEGKEPRNTEKREGSDPVVNLTRSLSGKGW